MNLYDCCMYFDEDLVLDLRLNVLNDHVDKFVIAEATKDHTGSDKKLNFEIDNFSEPQIQNVGGNVCVVSTDSAQRYRVPRREDRQTPQEDGEGLGRRRHHPGPAPVSVITIMIS